MRRVVEANGGDLTAALAVMAASKRRSPTVAAVVAEHTALLTGVAPGQQTGYRSQLRDHLSDRLGYRTDNPCHGVKLPKGTAASDEMCLLTSSEVGLILAQMTPRYRPLMRFLVGTGLRWGEATAVQVGDVVLDGATPSVRVVRAWKRGEDGRPYLGPPKTKRSRRTVSLPDALVDELCPLVDGRSGDEFLFVNALGGPVLHATFWPKHWAKAIDRAQHPVDASCVPDPSAPRLTKSPRIHDLRHYVDG